MKNVLKEYTRDEIEKAQRIYGHLVKNKLAFCYGEQGQFYTIGQQMDIIGLKRDENNWN